MATHFTGGCMCGAVRYECEVEPIAMGNCHCRDCQRATGSAFAAAILVPASTVNITGEVKYYEVTGDSGAIVRRGFCPNCGARLFGNPAASPDITDIMAGSLDDPSCYQPQDRGNIVGLGDMKAQMRQAAAPSIPHVHSYGANKETKA